MLETEVQMALDISNILKAASGHTMRWQQLSRIEWAKKTCIELEKRLDRLYTQFYREEYPLIVNK